MLTDNAFTDPLGGLVARLQLLRGTVSIGATTMPLTPRERVLVAALVRCGHPTQRVDLLALLWPDHEGARSANMLDISMHRLRKRLGFDVVVQIRGAYAISERAIVDVREIEHLAERILAERPGPSAIERYERVYADVACGCLSLGTDFEWLQRMERRFKNL